MNDLEQSFSEVLAAARAGGPVPASTLASLLGVSLVTLHGTACQAYPLSLPEVALELTCLQLAQAIDRSANGRGLAESLQALYAAPSRDHLVALLVARGWTPIP